MKRGNKNGLTLCVFATLLLSFVFVKATCAVESNVKFDFDVQPIITVTFSDSAAVLKSSSSGNLDEMKVGAEIRTNSRTGYTAFLSTDKKRKTPDDISATSLVHLVDSNEMIPALETATAAADFLVNHWGYSIDGGANYLGMSAANDTMLSSFVSSNLSENRNFDLYFATKTDNTKKVGFYENTIMVTAIANYVPKTINDIQYMQELDNEVANSLEFNEQYQLIDQRDGKKYWISRLDDDNVWMTQNLDYRLIDENDHINFSKESSDVLADTSYLVRAFEDGELVRGQYDPAIMMTLGWFSDNVLNGGIVTGERIARETLPEDSESLHYDLGTAYEYAILQWGVNQEDHNSASDSITTNYYNPSINIQAFDKYEQNLPSSVCPRGWRLPLREEIESLPFYYGVNRLNQLTEVGSMAFHSSPFWPIMTVNPERYYADMNNGAGYWYAIKTLMSNNMTNYTERPTALFYMNGSDYSSVQKSVVVTDGSFSDGTVAYVRCVMRW